MGALATTVIDEILDFYFGATTFTPPASFDVALSTTQPDDTGANVTEPSGGSYARANVPNDATHWLASANRVKLNALSVSFPTPTGTWGLIGWCALYDHGTGGFVGWGQLATARNITATSTPPTFAAQTLVVNAPA